MCSVDDAAESRKVENTMNCFNAQFLAKICINFIDNDESYLL